MFYNNPNLKTIYASDKFNTNAVTSSDDMFTGTTNICYFTCIKAT